MGELIIRIFRCCLGKARCRSSIVPQEWFRTVVGGVALCLVFWHSPSRAVVGSLDNEDKYPFVVQIESDTGSCSGAVSRSGLVSTAAHCVWTTEGGFAKSLRIRFRDADGYNRVVASRKIYIPGDFARLFRDWQGAAKYSVRSGETKRRFNAMTIRDIAFIVPERWVETEGFPHWITEVPGAESMTTRELEKTLGDLDGVRAMTIGFGNFECNDPDQRERGCRSDGRRRFAEMPLRPSETADGQTFSAPSIWCTGISAEGTNPIQHGDSGGPLFVKALDGRWLFVGYNSGGSSMGSCASSLIENINVWREAAAFHDANADSIWNGQGADNWEARQMRRFMEEVLESWSSPNSVALRRLDNLYSDGVQYCGQYEDFAKVREAKTRFAKAWPTRRYRIKQSRYIKDEAGEPVRVAGIRATVSWELENPATGTRDSGETSLELAVRYGYESELNLINDGNPPKIISEIVHRTTATGLALECPSDTKQKGGGGITLWNHNGSTVELIANGTKRMFQYDNPREGLLSQGVGKGTVLFSGKRAGNEYAGTAYVFSGRCGTKEYPVNGTVSADQRQIVMYGRAPRRTATCEANGFRDDVLKFDLVEDQ
jgi:hypothetical protein